MCQPGRICFSFATFSFTFGKRPPREMQTPRKTTDSQTSLPRELHCSVVDCINHWTDHNATIRRNTVENWLQPEQIPSSLKTYSAVWQCAIIITDNHTLLGKKLSQITSKNNCSDVNIVMCMKLLSTFI